jgi:hypothetical protein
LKLWDVASDKTPATVQVLLQALRNCASKEERGRPKPYVLPVRHHRVNGVPG